MQYVRLGRTGLKVSRLCLGTMNFGPETTEQDSHAIMEQARDLGINFFDTANVYGWKKGQGWTEQIIGRWLAQGGGRRESIVLATKVFGEMGDGPNEEGLSAYHIRQACEDSLRRLKTDHVDLYQMHHIQRETPLDEFWQAMEQLTRQGKILYVGSSNFPAWYITKAQMMASQRNFLGLVSEQCIYSLADRMVELEVLPAAQHFGLGVIPYSPLGGGMLAGILEKADSGRRASEWTQKKLEKHRDKVEKYEAFCAEIGQRPADVALAWVLVNPAVTAPIIGPRTTVQLARTVRALELQLDDSTRKRLDAIWPGSGGPAPEAYSW
ncbi:MAG: aldo/keto reductase [bacterium]|nr:aldo/keto reductase [bacterium]